MLRSALLFLLLAAPSLWAEALHFRLQSPQGEITAEDLAGKHWLLTLGYTSCPDICPTTLYEMAQVLKRLPQPEQLQMLFLSIDPVNDDLARLQAYTQYFDPRILGLSGELTAIEELTQQLGASFGYRVDGKKISNPQPGIPYTVYHSALIYLVSPTGELLDVFDYQMGAEDLSAALQQHLGQTPNPAAETAPLLATEALPPLGCPLPEGFEASELAIPLTNIAADIQAKKRLLLLNVWALWCQPCREELPLLDSFPAQNFQMEVLNLGDEAAAIEALFQQLNIQHLSRRSSQEAVLKRLNALGLPLTALFVDGHYRGRHHGLLTAEHLQAVEAFAACLNP